MNEANGILLLLLIAVLAIGGAVFVVLLRPRRVVVSPDLLPVVAQQQVSALRSHSFAQLISLPPCNDTTLTIEGQAVDVCTWRDALPDGSVRIMVQAHVPRLIGSYMAADGFITAPDGSRSEVAQDTLWEFS